MTATKYPDDFQEAVSKLFSLEGGYVDNPNDSGGPTNIGVTSIALAAYKHRTGKDWTTPTLTRDQASEYYFYCWWIPMRLQEIYYQPLKNVLLATAVNRGIGGTIMQIQRCAAMPEEFCDGFMGPRTVAYVNSVIDQSMLVDRFCSAQEDYYKKLTNQWYRKSSDGCWMLTLPSAFGAVQKNKVFEKGWLKRINSFRVKKSK